MARSKALPVLAFLATLAAAGLWGLWWAVATEALAPAPWTDMMRFRQELTWAAGAAWGLVVGFQVMTAALRRRRVQAARSMGQLETAAAIVLVVVGATILAGDFSSTLISLGLVGFGLTLALQRPILALAGWGTVFFGNIFREGDRIHVGDLVGDVLQISLFTTRIWEVGGPDTPCPGRPTGRIRTVSNAYILEHPVANATSDTAIVFDEFVVGVAYEADLALAKRLLHGVADQVLDPATHARSARSYERLTRGMRIEKHFPTEPTVLMDFRDSWIDLRLRYLVDARRASGIRTALAAAWQEASGDEDALPNVFHRTQPQAVGADGRPLHGPDATVARDEE